MTPTNGRPEPVGHGLAEEGRALLGRLRERLQLRWSVNPESLKQPEPDHQQMVACADLTAACAALERLTSARDEERALGWRDALSCVQYTAANRIGHARSDAEATAYVSARDDLVDELITAEASDWLNTEWKSAQQWMDKLATLQSSHDLALAEAERLREALGAPDGVAFAKAVSPAIAKFLDDYLDDYLSSEEAADHLAHTVHDALLAALKPQEPDHAR